MEGAICHYYPYLQDGRVRVGDKILAVDDEPIVGYPVEKVSRLSSSVRVR